jgi:hypothetical protein
VSDASHAPTRRACAALGGAVLLFALATAALDWLCFANLDSGSAFDLGAFNNQAFCIAHHRDVMYVGIGTWFKPGDREGPSVYRSNHFSPLRLAIVPQLYRLRPRLSTLFLVQGLFVGLGAFGLFGYALDRSASVGLAALLAATYLLHPAILHLAATDYRDISLGVGPALVALWLHARGSRGAFAVAALVMCAARSEFVPLLATFGLMNLRSRRASALWHFGLPVALALGWALLSQAYYAYFYGSVWPVLSHTAEHRSLETFAALLERVPLFLRTMLLPGFVSIASPESFALALPWVALARGVSAPAFPHPHLQHLAPAMVAVFWGFTAAIVRYWPPEPGRRRIATGLLLLAAGASALQFGVAALHTDPPEGAHRYARLLEWDAAIPADATVAAPMDLLAHFSHHTRVLPTNELPTGDGPFTEDPVVAVVRAADFVVAEPGQRTVTDAVVGIFEEIDHFKGYRAYRRLKDAPIVPDPDALLQRSLGWEHLSASRRRWATLAVGASRR